MTRSGSIERFSTGLMPRYPSSSDEIESDSSVVITSGEGAIVSLLKALVDSIGAIFNCKDSSNSKKLHRYIVELRH